MIGLIGAWCMASLVTGSVGRAEGALNPPEPLPLGGYTARQGSRVIPGGETLRVRCVQLQNIALVGIEMLTVPESLVSEVQKRVGNNVRVILVATHTHCAPDSQLLNSRMTVPVPGIATFQRRWLNWYADRIADVVLQAGTPFPGTIEFSVRTAHVPFARSRRPLGAPESRAVQINADGVPALSVFGAHPTLFDETELHTRGDWPGEWMNLSAGIVATGAIGDVSPVPPLSKASPGAQSRALAQALSRAMEAASSRSMGTTMLHVPWTIELPQPIAHPEFAKSYTVTPEIAQVVVAKFAPDRAQVNVLSFGRFAVIGVPGEPTARVARTLIATAKKHGFKDAVVLSHVNGWIGYILDAQDYHLGGYEATLSFHGPDVVSRIVKAVDAACAQMEPKLPT